MVPICQAAIGTSHTKWAVQLKLNVYNNVRKYLTSFGSSISLKVISHVSKVDNGAYASLKFTVLQTQRIEKIIKLPSYSN